MSNLEEKVDPRVKLEHKNLLEDRRSYKRLCKLKDHFNIFVFPFLKEMGLKDDLAVRFSKDKDYIALGKKEWPLSLTAIFGKQFVSSAVIYSSSINQLGDGFAQDQSVINPDIAGHKTITSWDDFSNWAAALK
jgi:hypothetical protein